MATVIKNAKNVVVSKTDEIGEALTEAFALEGVTAVRVGRKNEKGRPAYSYSVSKFTPGWSVRDERHVVANGLEKTVVRKRLARKIEKLLAEGEVIVRAHAREKITA